MEHRALAALILRIAGLLIIITSVTGAVRGFGPWLYPSDMAKDVGVPLLLLSMFVAVVIPVTIGLGLVYFPSSVASRVLKIEGLELTSESSTAPFQRVAFAAIGMWLTVHAVTDATYVYAKIRFYYYLLKDASNYPMVPDIAAGDFAALVAAGLKLIIGIWLLVGNRGIVNVLERLRG